MEKTTIGADPELFLIDLNGKYISAIDKVGGTKKRPRPIGQDCAVQEDNVAVEFNIPPANSAENFVQSCQYALEVLTKEMAEKDLFLSLVASKRFDKDQLEDDRAKVFGCEADFNAWTKQVNPSPNCVDLDLRSAGGHVHFGTKLNKIQIVRWADVTLGLSSVIEDSDTERRKLYGKAGAFRSKPYGVEYRTLSNYWLKHSALMEKIYNRALLAVSFVHRGIELKEKDGDRIQEAINTSNTALADQLLHQYTGKVGIDLEVA